MPADEALFHTRHQRQLDTRAIEIASMARAEVEQATKMFSSHIELVREDLKEMRIDRVAQHASAEAKFASILRAMWSGATAMILLLAGWVFYLATHVVH